MAVAAYAIAETEATAAQKMVTELITKLDTVITSAAARAMKRSFQDRPERREPCSEQPDGSPIFCGSLGVAVRDAERRALRRSCRERLSRPSTLAFIFFFSFRIHAISAATAQTLFWTSCTLMGLSLASVFLVFTGTSIARAFFITAAMFGATSLYGYTTKRDLQK